MKIASGTIGRVSLIKSLYLISFEYIERVNIFGKAKMQQKIRRKLITKTNNYINRKHRTFSKKPLPKKCKENSNSKNKESCTILYQFSSRLSNLKMKS